MTEEPEAQAVESRMRQERYIQLAHNIFAAVCADVLPDEYGEKERISHYLEALCWVLGHGDNAPFHDILRELTGRLLISIEISDAFQAFIERHARHTVN